MLPFWSREELHCQQLLAIKVKANGCEDVCVELRINNNESLVVGSVYRHPITNIKGFRDAFVHVIKTFKTNQNYLDNITRSTSTANTIIDRTTYVNGQILPVILYNDILDHLLICAEFRCRTQKNSSKRPIIRPLNKKKLNCFCSNGIKN